MFMYYSSGVYPDDTHVLSKKGVQAMIQEAIKIMRKPKEVQGPRLLLMAGQRTIRQREINRIAARILPHGGL
jgi:hypothetical protein